MASSVSSERAFSSAGITISKRRNRLKADIVEALQCLKCLYHTDLIFRDPVNTATVEEEMEGLGEVLDDSFGNQDAGNPDEEDDWSWDKLITDASDNEGSE